HHKSDLAIFGGAELDLVVVEIGGQNLRRGRIDRSGLRRAKLDVFDRALLVLEAGQRLDHRLGHLDPRRNTAGELPTERDFALIGDIALLGITELPESGLEALGVELAVGALEIGIVEDRAPDFLIGLSKSEAPGLFIECGFRNRLLEHLTIDAEGAS